MSTAEIIAQIRDLSSWERLAVIEAITQMIREDLATRGDGKEDDGARHRALNAAAFRRQKPKIDQEYPKGRFIAFEEGQIVGDGPTFRELHASLEASGKTSRDILVVQAGVNYPEYVPFFPRSAR